MEFITLCGLKLEFFLCLRASNVAAKLSYSSPNLLGCTLSSTPCCVGSTKVRVRTVSMS